jgi:restriction system protein
MRQSRKKSSKTDPARQVLGMAASFLALGVLLLLASLAVAGLRAPAPYLLLIGGVLLAWGISIRLRHGKPLPSRFESRYDSTHLGNTTVQGSQLDSRAGDLLAEPSNRNLRPQAAVWNAQVFRDIEWRRFEAVCATLFAQSGLAPRIESQGAHSGADLWLYSQHAEGPAAIVRCRHWVGKAVTINELRELRELMASHKVLRGTFATTGKLKPDAREFAKANGINPLDGLGLLALISQRTAEQKKELLQIAYEGDYWRPSCANCGQKMVERRARKRGKTFWGCVDYPRCDFTLPVRKTG